MYRLEGGVSYDYTPTYDELYDDYKSGAIDKNALIDLAQKRKELDYKQANNQQLKDTTLDGVRAVIGGGLEGASFHPILNIPYIGTGLGGALFEWGDSINNKRSAIDTLKNMGKGFVVGETVGAIPYAGKAIGKTKVGSKFGDVANKAYQRIADTSIGAKIGQGLNKVGDLLMTDVKAFNPNKQTVYHGSPYNFDKFSNEAIGTGEGFQAHGLGHYVAKNRNIAESYRKRLTNDFDHGEYLLDNAPLTPKQKDLLETFNDYRYSTNQTLQGGKEEYIKQQLTYLQKLKSRTDEAAERQRQIILKYIDEANSINLSKLKQVSENNLGQLYKLKIPNDNVMIREKASFTEQPQAVQKALRDIQNDILQSKGYNSIDEINSKLDALNAEYEALNNKPILPWESSPTSQIQAEISNLERLRDMYTFGGSSKNIYSRLNGYYGDKTNELLASKGIKGISYNGGIDGEANVVFNPDDIDIVRKYYNQPELWEQLKGLKPNEGAELTAIENALRNPQYPMSEQDFKNYENLGLKYYQNILQPNTVDVPNYGTIEFSRKNKGKDDITNFSIYPDLFDLLKGAKKINRTNYKNELDREYDYLENPDNKLYQFLIEDIKDKGKRYKKTKNLKTNK